MEPIKIRVHENITITIHEWVRARSKEHAIRRYAGETISGDEWSWRHQIWVQKTRVIDKRHDWYEERVIDPETGAILHECAEPLSTHRGHGSAKKHPPRH
jgi:hypothetical protein